MSPLAARLSAASSAEEIFALLEVPFDAAVVNVNRLHILKRFNQYLAQEGALEAGLSAARAAALLARAYGDFVGSSAREQKALKVFQRGAIQRISADTLRGRRAGKGLQPSSGPKHSA